MALFSRKNLKKVNPYGLTEEDLIDGIEGLPMGVVVRMLEEQTDQGNRPDVNVFQEAASKNYITGGFDLDRTEFGDFLWAEVIRGKKFYLFFERYPEYEKYNL